RWPRDSPWFRVDADRGNSRKIASSACPPSRGAGIIRRFMTTLSAGTTRPSLARSLVGKKVVMAVTGGILFLFVVGHLLGNLKVFQGPEHFNAYAEGLKCSGPWNTLR